MLYLSEAQLYGKNEPSTVNKRSVLTPLDIYVVGQSELLLIYASIFYSEAINFWWKQFRFSSHCLLLIATAPLF